MDAGKTTKVVKTSNRGAKPGERRGGRVAGVPNKATVALKDIAREYTDEAVKALVQVLREGDSEQARIAAANAILDRGYGKPSQVLNGDADGGPVQFQTITRQIKDPAIDG